MHRRWGAAAILAIAAMACGKAKSDAANTGIASTSEDLAHQLADAVCGALASCCSAAGYGYDPDACTDQEVAQWSFVFADLRRANVKLDEDAFAACRQGLAAREAKCTGDAAVIDGGVDSPASPCGRILVGSIPAGRACDVSAQCAYDATSQTAMCAVDLTDPASPTFGQSFCQVTDIAQPPGATCTAESFQASPTTPRVSNCDPARGSCVVMTLGDATGVCTVFLDAGSTCNYAPTEPSCPPDAQCATVLGSQPTCGPTPTAGQSCATGGSCATGLYCDPTSMLCAAQKGAGEACGGYAECAVGFCAGYQLPDGGTRDGKCYAAPETSSWEASPRACGFGPLDYGPDDAGIPLNAR